MGKTSISKSYSSKHSIESLKQKLNSTPNDNLFFHAFQRDNGIDMQNREETNSAE